MSKTLHPLWSDKHKAYMQRAIKSTVAVAEGAVRSGKSVDQCALFGRMIDLGVRDRIHLATGNTVASAKTIIGDCGGFGLEHIFRGRCKWGKYKDNEALYITSHGRQYVVIFVGGGKSDSLKRIRGYSIGMWIATEIDLHHPDFVREALNRQLAATTRRIFWDLNPSSPANWIYKDYIDKFPQQFPGQYTYEHFTIQDNMSMTPQRLAEIESQYEPGSVFYRRYILGERCNAEGLIYPMFSADRHIVDYTDVLQAEAEEDAKRNERDREQVEYYVSCDYGIQNATVYLLWRKIKYENAYICCKEYYYSGREKQHQKTDAELVTDLTEWLDGTPVKQVIVDPSASSLIVALRQAHYTVLKAKNDVLPGISAVSQCLQKDIIYFDASCKHTIEEFGIYSWDPAKCEKGEDSPLKQYDHCMDACRYFVFTKHILRKATRSNSTMGDSYLL